MPTPEQIAALFALAGKEFDELEPKIKIFSKNVEKTGTDIIGLADRFRELTYQVEPSIKNYRTLIDVYKRLEEKHRDDARYVSMLTAAYDRLIEMGVSTSVQLDLIREKLGLKTSSELKGIEKEIYRSKELLKGKEVDLRKEDLLVKAYQRRKEYDLLKAQLKEKAAIVEGQGGIVKLARIRWEQMRADADAFFTKTFGVQSATMLKYGGWVALVAMLMEGLIRSFAESARGARLLIRTGGLLTNNYISNLAVISDLSIAAAKAGVSFDEMQRYVNTAVDEYIAGLYQIGKTYEDVSRGGIEAETDRARTIISTVEKLTYVASGLGMSAEAAIKSATRLGVMYAIPIEQLGDQFQIMARSAERMGIHAEDLTKLLEGLGEDLRYTDVRFKGITADTISWAKTLYITHKELSSSVFWTKKFQSNFTQMMTVGLQTFAKITPEAYLAYVDKPIKDIGEAWAEAVSATPIQKMIAARDRLFREVSGATSPEAMAGRLALLIPELREMGAAGYRLAEAMMRISEVDREQIANLPSDQQWTAFLTKIPEAQRRELETIGGNLQRFENPIQFLTNLVQIFLKSWFTFAAKILDITGIFRGGSAEIREQQKSFQRMLSGSDPSAMASVQLRRLWVK